MTLGEKVRELREVKGISQKELGEALQMTQRKISYIENDKFEPGIDDIRALCLYFNISSDYLIGLPKNMPYPYR